MTTMQQVADGQTYPEVPINENFEATSAFAIFGKRHPVTSGLTWGYYGGYYDSTLIADGTVTLTNAAANYVVVERTTGTVSVSTATTNWNNTTDYGRLYKLTTAGGVVTATEDHRFGSSGILTSSGAGAVASVNGQTGVVVLDAGDIAIADSDNVFAGSTVEEALEQLAGSGGVASVNGQTGAVVLTAKDIAIVDSDSRYAGSTIEEALEEVGGSAGVTSVNGEIGAVVLTAADISILDSNSVFAGATIEEALEEVGGAILPKAGISITDAHFMFWDTGSGARADDLGVSISIDGTFADDSDFLIPTQKAIRTYIGSGITAGQIQIVDSDSHFVGSTVEDALEELFASIGTVQASDVLITDSDSLLTATNVEDALEELAGKQGTGLDVDAFGFRGIPQNSQSASYTLVAADAGKHIYHASGAGAGDTYTIPANGSVAFEVGTAVTFINMDSNSCSIAITTDTLTWSPSGTTGTRTLAQYGVCTAVKVTSTQWVISGTGLS